MLPETKLETLKRLAFVAGHLEGVRKMVENDTYCVDVLKQTFAVRRAIEKLEGLLLEGHIRSCVIEDIKEGREDVAINELIDLFKVSNQ